MPQTVLPALANKLNITHILKSLKEPWSGLLLSFSLLLCLPIYVIYFSLFDFQVDTWSHLLDTVLASYIFNSLLIALGVGVGSIVLGVALGYCIAHYQFFGRSILHWFILLPLAMPAYIIAYTYTGMLDFSGPVQTWIREAFSLSYGEYWFPEVRSLGGAIVMLTLVLYPYVYMLARTAFADQAQSLREASQSFGYSNRQHFFKVSIPLARPAIIVGASLAMMEAFADYGTVEYFGVSTFTTGIFRTWFGLGNSLAAAQLASILCSFVLILLIIEKSSRRKLKYYNRAQNQRSVKRIPLNGWKSIFIGFLCFLPPLFAFLIPVLLLIQWAIVTLSDNLNSTFFILVWNSFRLAAMAAGIAVLLSLFFAYGLRLHNNVLNRSLLSIVRLGYAIPGTVIAVGILLPLSWFDHSINAFFARVSDWQPGLILSGSLFALLFAYSVRFLAVSLGCIESGLLRITPSMDDAARSLGMTPGKVLTKVHIPLLKSSVLVAFLLVFVDVLKELPATLILRPFNFNTLAVRTYEMAADERLLDAAMPALAIVLVGLLPVIILNRTIDKQ